MQNGVGSVSFNSSSAVIETSTKECLKTQFITREGVYKQMTVSDQLSRPHRMPPAQVCYRIECD
jgi:hypothetical protein